MMKALLIFAILAVAAVAARTEKESRKSFLDFVRQNKRHYSQEEFQTRYAIFKANLDFIDDWNTKGLHRVAVNRFADLTSAEFNKLYLGTQLNVEEPQYVASTAADSVDWRTQGAVTAVKDQGQCGSCWSFSTTGSTEGAHFLATGKLVSLSEQNLIDCSKKQGNKGCDGGLMTQAMNYIIENKGIDTEASYPYKAKEDWSCKFDAANIGATLSNYTNVQSGSESDLAAKAALGPVSVAIDASHMSFQLYADGVYYEPACSPTVLDHGVLVVGYGADSTGAAYWIVKNSWAASWGLDGYIWMSRNRNNNCGIATSATLPHA